MIEDPPVAPGRRDSALLIRVWFEPDGPQRLRARLLSFDQADHPQSLATAAGEDAVVAALTGWLRGEAAANELSRVRPGRGRSRPE